MKISKRLVSVLTLIFALESALPSWGLSPHPQLNQGVRGNPQQNHTLRWYPSALAMRAQSSSKLSTIATVAIVFTLAGVILKQYPDYFDNFIWAIIRLPLFHIIRVIIHESGHGFIAKRFNWSGRRKGRNYYLDTPEKQFTPLLIEGKAKQYWFISFGGPAANLLTAALSGALLLIHFPTLFIQPLWEFLILNIHAFIKNIIPRSDTHYEIDTRTGKGKYTRYDSDGHTMLLGWRAFVNRDWDAQQDFMGHYHVDRAIVYRYSDSSIRRGKSPSLLDYSL